MTAFAEGLRAHRSELDSLNVFPVPDGDAGTNLLATQEAVLASVAALPAGSGAGLPTLCRAVTDGSLMGARGNSGVILSQVLRGLCHVLARDEAAGAASLAAALSAAATEAYRAVVRPREGTMLSVLRDAATAARQAEGDHADAEPVVEAAMAAARESLAGTREILPELREAGVVDAGGKGIVLLLDSLRSALLGVPLSEPVGPLGPVGREAVTELGSGVQVPFGYEVRYLLEAGDGDVDPLRAALADLGDSVVVVGGGGRYHVHVHTNDPAAAVEVGEVAGRTRDVAVADLAHQVEACLAGPAAALGAE
jgi:dihydroxyacetone kinase-like predicted kinase